jgi:hypothetical protein
MRRLDIFGFFIGIIFLTTSCHKTTPSPISSTASAQALLQHTWMIDSMYFVNTTNTNQLDTVILSVDGSPTGNSSWQFLANGVLLGGGGGGTYSLIDDSTLTMNLGAGPSLYHIMALTSHRFVTSQNIAGQDIEIMTFNR